MWCADSLEALTTSEGSEEALTSLPKRRALRPLEAEPVGWPLGLGTVGGGSNGDIDPDPRLGDV